MNSSMINQAVEVLNRALAADPRAIQQLFEFRVPCNQVLADDPTVQVRSEKDGASVGILGIINGIFGVQPGTFTGYIAAVCDVVCPEHGNREEFKNVKAGDPCPVDGCGQKLQVGPIQRFEDITIPKGQ